MIEPSVAVVKSDFHDHQTCWSHEWGNACAELGVAHELIDWRSIGAFDRLMRHNIVLWHFSHYSADEMKFARPMLSALKAAGRTVFPDRGDSDHFDDKVAQAYLMQGLGLPTPKNYPLHSQQAVESWIQTVGTYPVVAKLRAGSGSSNVILIETADQLLRYAKRMFGRGFCSRPNALFKLQSNLVSSRSFAEVVKRAKRAPEFLFSWRNASRLGRESGYVYLQEFVPGVDYDLKVVVVGEQLSFICRAVRKDDFRASGGGDLFYDRSLITPSLIKVAFEASAALGSDCTGFDMVIDPRTQRPVILEVSYGFSHSALLQAGGYFDRSGTWHDVPLNAPRALLQCVLTKAQSI
ncbi:RimK family alpha-L-glutamate ligase [Azonexus sp.]|uniref:ATP-grasp domain-containing protein n=1 Tax=Azonexus sp. TaxID=1872668 RepID=UPI0035AFBCAE